MKDNLVPIALQHDAYWAIEEAAGQLLLKQLEATDASLHRRLFEANKTEIAVVNVLVEAGAPQPEARGSESEPKPFDMTPSGIALIRIVGPMTKSPTSWDSGTSTVRVRRQIRAAANDSDVKGILLVIDSPGGSVSGTSDLGDDIAAAASKKQVVSYIEDYGCSAAYWAASQANEVYANPTAMVGSIGTYMALYDYSRWAENIGIKAHVLSTGKYKGAGVEGSEITDEQLAAFQQTVDDLNEHFLAAVSRGRNMERSSVDELAHGGVWVGEQAVANGLIDGIASLDDVLTSMTRTAKPKGGSRAENNDLAEGEAPVRVTFEQTLDSALAAVAGANKRISQVISLRAEQGRKLGSERMSQLRELHADLASLVASAERFPQAEATAEAETPEPEATVDPERKAMDEAFELAISSGVQE